MTSDFVHLHFHSDYSLLDGACAVEPLEKGKMSPTAELALAYKMPAIALTDHGFMGGGLVFYNEMNSRGIKPIIGCEMYLAKKSRKLHERDYAHLILLAKDWEGYQNLCRLMSNAFIEGFYYKPRIDKEILAQHSKGLIALSACLAGEIPSALLNNDMKSAHHLTDEYISIFGRENFFIELMDHGMDEQKKVNQLLIPLASQFGLKTVATNDVHYLKKEHAEAHDLLLCIGTKSRVKDERRFKFSSRELYFKSEEEMRQLFPDQPEAITNTRLIAEMCNLFIPTTSNTKGLTNYPAYSIENTEWKSQREYLQKLCFDAIPERYHFDPNAENLTEYQKGIIERANYELGIVDRMGFCSYYLVVWDFLKFARDNGIPVGPGRGSGAGSILAYLTHITDIDPIRYNLIFERFLNPERVSPPDFDIDFCERRRSEVIEYVRKKYGTNSVSQIGTYGTLKVKAAIKDVARVLDFSPEKANQITKMIEGSPETLDTKVLEANKDFAEFLKTDKETQMIVEKATPIFNLNRNMTIHAAGVIIWDKPIADLVPLAKGKNDEVITQYSSIPCESMGLLKMDFLGLRTLTILQDAVDLVKKSQNIVLDLSTISLEDEKTYEMIGRGDTIAVFQLESSGMQDLCRKLEPTKIEEIIALIALYRPGPMQFIPQFIEGKKDPSKVKYAHPLLESICKETYGILVYQEQVMEAARVVAGYSLGGADMLRRAMGKKKPEEMAKQKDKFIKGAQERNQISEEMVTDIFAILEKFAQYGFNKSHSAAYAFVAYRTAYMKANYPVEFMAAVLTAELNHVDKLRFFITECRSMGIEIKGPDVNTSYTAFSVDKGAIRFGLAAIKGVGSGVTDSIIKEREENGEYKSFNDFCERVVGIGESTIVSLIKTGAFDSFNFKRSQLLAILPDVLKSSKNVAKDRANGQMSLFDMFDSSDHTEQNLFAVEIPDIPEIEESEMLNNELELLGFWLSGHPLAKYESLMRTFITHTIFEVRGEDRNMDEIEGVDDSPEGTQMIDIEGANPEERGIPNDTPVRIAGIVKTVMRKTIKNSSKPFFIIVLEGMTGEIDCLLFEKTLMKELGPSAPLDLPSTITIKDYLMEGVQILVEGFVSRRDPSKPAAIMAERVIPLEKMPEVLTEECHIHLFENCENRTEKIKKIYELCKQHPGNSRLVLCIKTIYSRIVFIEAHEKYNITPSLDFLAGIQKILGQNRYKLKPDNKLPQSRPRRYPKKDENTESTNF